MANDIRLKLPSGKVAVIGGYNAFCANAIADADLQEAGTAWAKALSGLIRTLDDEPYPRWAESPKKCIQAADKLLMLDMQYILFVAAAVYHEGMFVGDIDLPDGGKVPAPGGGIELLDENGHPLPHFMPGKYPLGSQTVCEWSELVEDLGREVKFKFELLTGKTLRTMAANSAANATAQYRARRPSYENLEKEGRYNEVDLNRSDVPAWATRIIGKKIREVDPVIDWSVTIKVGAVKHKVSMFAVTDFFLQDFM